MAGPFYAALASYVLMLAAFYWHRQRAFHVPVMISVILFDLLMPVYLVMNRDWYRRLLEQGDILSFGVWMHFGLIVTLFVLYAIQVHTALRMLRPRDGDPATVRRDHRAQGLGILLARALVIVSGAVLYEPEPDS